MKQQPLMSRIALTFIYLIGVCAVWGQGPARPANGPKPAVPTALPPPGTYTMTSMVSLYTTTPGATIHYTLDGAQPTASSPQFDPYKVLPINAVNQGDAGVKTGYTIRAVAILNGVASEPATFFYNMERRDRTTYISANLRPGMRLIRDYDNDKIYLIRGTKRALLVDTGMGTGNLRQYVEQFTQGLPLDVVVTHQHPDHIGQADQFISDSNVYVGERDRDSVAAFLKSRKAPDSAIQAHLVSLQDGHTFDRAEVADSFWMHTGNASPMDVYLPALLDVRSHVRGKVTEIFTGHNDRAVSEKYLDNLQTAVQQVIDQGPESLVPSLRPTNVWQVNVGDRWTDPDWVGINLTKEKALSVPADQIATLARLDLSGGALGEPFDPAKASYTVRVGKDNARLSIIPTSTSTRVKTLAVNGSAVKSGSAFEATLNAGKNPFTIRVVAPDGKTEKLYSVTVIRGS
jgi:hypothetical protein